MTQSKTQAPKSALRWAAGGAACLLPMIIVFLSPAKSDTALVYIGLLPAFVALTTGPRVALATAFATGAAVFFGLLLSTNAWGATVLMVLLGLGVVWSYRYGWQAAATYVASQGALAAIASPQASMVSDLPASSLVSAAVVTAFVLFGGLWVAMMGFLLLGDLPGRHSEPPVESELRLFAGILCFTLGIGTWVIMTFSHNSNAWWVLLTALVVLEPGRLGTMRRALERSGGTILGGGLAALVVVLIDSTQVISMLGILAAIASAITYVKAPYWTFSASLTMALIFLMLPVEHMLRGDLERVGFTVLAAVLVVALVTLAQLLQQRHIKRTGHTF